MCNSSLGVQEPKWMSHVKRPSDVAQGEVTVADINEDAEKCFFKVIQDLQNKSVSSCM